MKQQFTLKNRAFAFLEKGKKTGIMIALILISLLPKQSRACSPLNVPGLVTQTIVGSNLLLDFVSNTTYNCSGYYIEVELICNNASFTGLTGLYNGPVLNKTTTPQSFAQQSISLLNLCPGAIYKWRAREVYPGNIFSGYTQTYTFTAPGNYVAPTMSIIASPSFICIPSNTSSALNASVTSACGASSLIVYSWSPATGLSNPNIANPIASPTANITYTCIASSTVGCWTLSNTISFNVNSIPMVVVASPPNICVGASSTLSVSGAATSYTWVGGSNQTSIVVTPNATTVYTVTGQNSNGCSNTVAVTVTVNPTVPVLSIVSSSNNICQGGTVSLTGTGANTYSWTGLVTNGIAFSPGATSGYTVTGTNACGNSTLATSVTVNPTPPVVAIASTPSLCSGATATLIGQGANTYTWANGIINGGSFMPLVTSGYTVTGFSAFGCTATAATTITVVQTPTNFPTASPGLICVGSSATISASGAQNYSWSPGGTNLSSFAVSPTITTVYTVTKTNGVCSDIKSVTLTVNNLPFVLAISTPSTICALKQSTLTGAGGQSYTWAPQVGIGNNMVVTGNVTTIYTVTASDGTCVNTGTVLLNVLPNPTISIAPTASVLCLGECATVAIGGADTYTWVPANITGTNVVLCPTTTSSYSVSGTNSVGCTTGNSQVLAVNPVPNINVYTGKPMVCANESSTLLVNGANSYSWSGGPTGTVYVVTPGNTSTYSVTGYYGGTGCNITKSIEVVVFKPNFNVPLSPSTCIGGTVTLTASGADSYTWSPNFAFPTIYVSPNVYTIYNVSATSTSLNINNTPVSCVTSKTVGVSIYTNPTISAIPSRTAICKNESVTITGGGAATYSWSTLQTGSVIAVAPQVQTTYSVSAADINGCKGTAFVSIKVNQCTGLEEYENGGVSFVVYPNPNNGEFTVMSKHNITLRIIDGLGRTVRLIVLTESNRDMVNLKDLGAGIYYMIDDGGGPAVKVVVGE